MAVRAIIKFVMLKIFIDIRIASDDIWNIAAEIVVIDVSQGLSIAPRHGQPKSIAGKEMKTIGNNPRKIGVAAMYFSPPIMDNN